MSKMVLNARQLACLASPARNEVFMQLRVLGEGSAGDIARAMGKRPEGTTTTLRRSSPQTSLGWHSVVHRPRSPRRFVPVGKELSLPPPNAGPEVAALSRKAVRAGLTTTVRAYMKAAETAENDGSVRARMHLIRANIRPLGECSRVPSTIGGRLKFASEHRAEDGVRLVWSSVVYPPT